MNAMRDRVIEQARSMPDLISKAQTFDPGLAKMLKGKALIASKTVWGTAATMAISWGASRYGLGWDAETCALISFVLTSAATGLLRTITSGPVTGIIAAEPPT